MRHFVCVCVSELNMNMKTRVIQVDGGIASFVSIDTERRRKKNLSRSREKKGKFFVPCLCLFVGLRQSSARIRYDDGAACLLLVIRA